VSRPSTPATPTQAQPLTPPGPAPELPHWAEPATGETPRTPADAAEGAEQGRAWSGSARSPRWRDEGHDWDEEFGETGLLADEETRLGALDTSRPEHSDLYSFEEPQPTPSRSPQRVGTRRPGPEAAVAPGRRLAGAGGGPRHARDNGAAIAIGGGLALLFLILASAGPRYVLVLAAAVVVLIAAEVFAVLRRAGYKPATLLGLVATLSLVFACYWKGERAMPLILVLTVAFTMLWYLAGVITARPTVNVAATLFGFAWPGFFGAYAALLLRPSEFGATHPRDGVAFLLGAVICTVTNDVVAYAAGRSFGRTPLAPSVSPNKTLEGYLIALAATVFVGTGIVSRIHPWHLGSGFWLGVVIGVVAPLGDLCESMIKRDIGVKDMGSLLPGHGGFFDRFDALIFALPATFYLVEALKVGRIH